MNASRSPCSVMPCFGRSGSSLAEYCLLMLRGTLACRYCAEVPALSVKHRFRQVRPYPSGTPGRNSGIAGLQPLPRFSVPLLTLLAKSTIRPEDARNPVKHLGSKRRFLPSVAVQIATSEFANSVRCYSDPVMSTPGGCCPTVRKAPSRLAKTFLLSNAQGCRLSAIQQEAKRGADLQR